MNVDGEVDAFAMYADLRRWGSLILEDDEGKALVLTMVNTEDVRAVLVGYEGRGCFLWREGSSVPDRFSLISAGMPYTMAEPIVGLLAEIATHKEAPQIGVEAKNA